MEKLDAINIYYKGYLAEIGGIETVTYNIAYKYAKQKDILFLLGGGHPNQIKRLIEIGARLSTYDSKRTYRCKRVFVTSEKEIPNNIVYEEAVRVSHATPEDLMKYGFRLPSDMNKAINYGVSKYVCQNTEKIAKVKCIYCPNPYIEEQAKPLLKLVSPQRMSWEKGLPLMQKMAEELEKHNIPFIWTIICNNLDDVVKLNNKNFVFLKSRLDIKPYIKDADYLVLLSNTEGSPMAPQEALMMGVPIVVTHLPWVDDLDILDKGFFLDLDLSNLDVEEIYRKKGTFKFKWNPPKDIWGDLLLDGKIENKELKEMKLCLVKATQNVLYAGGVYIQEAGGIPKPGDTFEVLEERLDTLATSNNVTNKPLVELIKVIEEKKVDDTKKEVKKTVRKENKNGKNTK